VVGLSHEVRWISRRPVWKAGSRYSPICFLPARLGAGSCFPADGDTGDMTVIRYADDTIVGFQHEHEAQAFLDDLKERMRKFELALHPDKTRLIRFGRHAARSSRLVTSTCVPLHYCDRTRRQTGGRDSARKSDGFSGAASQAEAPATRRSAAGGS
jgi:hypothetical protein